MAALDSLIPSFDDSYSNVNPNDVDVKKDAVDGLVDYSDDDMPGLEAGATSATSMPALESEGEDEADDEAEGEAEEDDLNTSADVEGTVEEHPLEKDPLEIFAGINVCVYSTVFCLGMITALVITKVNSV